MAKKTIYHNNSVLSFPSGQPAHWTRFNKSTWYLRDANKLSAKYVTRLEEVVDKSYEILINQIAGNAI